MSEQQWVWRLQLHPAPTFARRNLLRDTTSSQIAFRSPEYRREPTFAHQLHVAYSSKIHGVGLLAASPYYCAKEDLSKALQYCSKIGAEFGQPHNGPPTPDYVESLVSDTKKAFNEDQIDGFPLTRLVSGLGAPERT